MCGFWLENSGFADPFLAPAGAGTAGVPPAHCEICGRDARGPRGCRCDFLAEGAGVRSPERGGGEKGFILSAKQHLCAVNRE